MNAVHRAVYEALLTAAEVDDLIAEVLRDTDETTVMRQLFSNYRGDGATAKGMRLSSHGLSIMSRIFEPIKVLPNDKTPITSRQQLFLDRVSALPYFYSSVAGFILFDQGLGVRLVLANGSVDLLMRLEGYSRFP